MFPKLNQCVFFPAPARIVTVIAAALALFWFSGNASTDERQVGFSSLASDNSGLQTTDFAPQLSTDVVRDPIRARIEQLSEHDVKRFYLRCNEESLQRRLDSGEASICSIGYDILLTKHFKGNFHALLAWSRDQREAGWD